jgi:microcystin-dependent protein
MSNCSNCYNGCTEIVSDKCVRYTGVDVPILGIQSGDSLSFVEQALITFLTSTLDGSGIIITLPENSYCEAVTKNLPTCGEITATILFEALVKTACDLQEQIDAIVADIATIEAPYTVGCLTGVTSTSGTHDILQAVITKLCQLGVDLTALALDVDTNYVKLADLDSLIQAYLNSIAPATDQQYKKMVPYTVVEYYGTLGNFNADGSGKASLGWDKIYLCVGQSVGSFIVPDKRGRVPVGAINGLPGGGPLSPAVDPNVSLTNPNYSLYATAGSNTVTLTIPQIPSHTHTATVVTELTPNPHHHALNDSGANASGGGGDGAQRTFKTGGGGWATGDVTLDLTVAVTNSNEGGGTAHNNIQPVLACYYIIYVP